jgi:6-phosphofructokinase 1
LKARLEKRGHAVIVATEGAGQNLMSATGQQDASGNICFEDIGLFLKDRINAYFKEIGMKVELKYIDPSYTIRSLPANSRDSAFCLLLGHNAVHGKTSSPTSPSDWPFQRANTLIPKAGCGAMFFPARDSQPK